MRTTTLIDNVLFRVLANLGSTGTGGGTTMEIGLASVRISPSEPVRMSGNGSRTQPSTGVANDLYAKAWPSRTTSDNRRKANSTGGRVCCRVRQVQPVRKQANNFSPSAKRQNMAPARSMPLPSRHNGKRALDDRMISTSIGDFHGQGSFR